MNGAFVLWEQANGLAGGGKREKREAWCHWPAIFWWSDALVAVSMIRYGLIRIVAISI
jgi:hypothetical protein